MDNVQEDTGGVGYPDRDRTEAKLPLLLKGAFYLRF